MFGLASRASAYPMSLNHVGDSSVYRSAGGKFNQSVIRSARLASCAEPPLRSKGPTGEAAG